MTRLRSFSQLHLAQSCCQPLCPTRRHIHVVLHRCPDVDSEWALRMISKYPVELPVKMLLDHSDSVISSNFLFPSLYILAFEGLKRRLFNGGFRKYRFLEMKTGPYWDVSHLFSG
jgi:hypothetical protein